MIVRRSQFVVVVALVLGAGGRAAAQPHDERRADRILNAWIAQADRWVERGREAPAARVLKRAIRRAPDDPRAPLRLFRLWVPSAAREAADADESVRDRAAAVAEALGAARSEPTGELRLAGAWSVAVAGDPREAIERVALGSRRLDAASVDMLRKLAALAVRRHDLRAADDALEAARRIDPITVELLTDLAAVRLARGDANGAVELLLEARERRPDHEVATRDLPGALLAAGRTTDAVELLSAQASEAPNDGGVQLAFARAASQDRQHAVALRAAKHAVTLLPADPAPALVAAAAAVAVGRRDEAKRLYREALRRDPDNAHALEGLRAIEAHTEPTSGVAEPGHLD